MYDPPSFIGSNRLPARLYPSGERNFLGRYWPYPLYGFREEDTSIPYNDYIGNFLEEQGNIQLYTGVGADGRAYLLTNARLSRGSSPMPASGKCTTLRGNPKPHPAAPDQLAQHPRVKMAVLRWWEIHLDRQRMIRSLDLCVSPGVYGYQPRREDTVYGCGSSMGKAPECMAYGSGQRGCALAYHAG